MVPGLIEVDGQKVDVVAAVLLPVGLQLGKQHLLGQAIGSISLLGTAVPEILLLEGDWGELGVGADGARLNELLESMKPCLFNELNAHDSIVVEEGTRS